MKMCQAFADNGHETTLFARYGWGWSNVFQQYNVAENFQIVKYWRPNFLPKKLRIWIYIHLLSHRVKKINSNADLLYGRDVHGLLSLSNLGIPIIYEAHSSPRGKGVLTIEAQLFRQKNFLRLVVISQALRQEYLDLFPWFSGDKVIVAHDGADIPVNTGCSDSQTTKNSTPQIQIGYVGHLYAGKGMEIIAELVPCMPNVHFHIVGGMPEDVKHWQGKLAQYKNITFYGFIWQRDMPAYFRKFDIVLAPYPHGRYSKWTSPLKIFEYMAARKAIIASDLAVLREILTHNVNALLASPENIEDWIGQITALGHNEQLRNQIAARAFQDLVSQYTWKKRAAMVLEGLNSGI